MGAPVKAESASRATSFPQRPAARGTPLAQRPDDGHHAARARRMFGHEYSEDHRPVTYFRGYPIHAATLLVIVHVAAFILCAIGQGSGLGRAIAELNYSSTDVLTRGAVWQFLTYAFVHPASEGVWFAIEMWLLFQFGREVERFLGRRAFLQLYGALLLVGPIVLTLTGLFVPTAFGGSSILHFAIFVAFAALYPSVGVFFGIAARWVAVAILVIYTLQGFAFHAISMLLVLWTTAPLAFGFVQMTRSGFAWPTFRLPGRKPKFRVVPKPAAASPNSAVEDDAAAEMDVLLDKIAKSGIASLSSKERTRLERAREALLKKDQR